MSENQNIDSVPERVPQDPDTNIASSEVSSVARSVKSTKTTHKVSTSSERQIKFERAQKCLENAALVSKRIKEHRKATAELLGRPFEDDDVGDAASEVASTVSERTGYSVATETSTTLSVQDALNIPGISESLANTLKQKELLMERIKQYKEISKRPMTKPSIAYVRRESSVPDTKVEVKKSTEGNEQLLSSLKEKENALSVMQVKMKAMETTILDLQEKINEKDQIIEAKNRATTLISDSLSKKEKDSLALLEDTRQQMTKMQENFISMELEWNEEKQRLLKDIEAKEEKIKSLEEANTILESSRFEISIEHSKLLEELELKNKEILHLEEKIQNLTLTIEDKPSEKERDDHEEEKGTREIENMEELTKKIELLEQLNCQIRQTNKELENKLASINTETKPTSSPSKKASPLPSRKGRNTASKQKSPWSKISSESLPQETDKKVVKNEVSRLEIVVQSLNKEILEKEYALSQKDLLIAKLQEAKNSVPVEPKRDLVETGVNTDIVDEPHEVREKIETETTYTTDATPSEGEPMDVKELELKLKEAQEQIAVLNNEIDAANKNMIKVKSNHKLKLKQMQKTIDNLSKVSDANAEIVRLNEELHQLTQKVAELEEEKGNLQLHLVDYDSGRLTESDVYKKLVEMENLAETRLKAISVLETQKFDLVQELHTLQQKNMEMEDRIADISQIQTEQVSTEIKSVQLEEQIDKLNAAQKELELVIDNLKLDKEQLMVTIKELQEEKEELNHKLENYIQENMDLTDKLEKLSAEKVSSAESIEIVESLTTQEKLELEEYNKGVAGDKMDDNSTHVAENKNVELYLKQIEELNKKIELFTQEREEVMDKMNHINTENASLQQKITDINNECANLRDSVEQFEKERNELMDLNADLHRQIDELKRERIEIIKETAEASKPMSEDTTDGASVEAHPDEKSSNDKGMNRTKSVKQLTKEILKLKNTVKEREDEIADCHMKILSLEEQQQKQNDMLKANSGHENKLKSLMDENQQLLDEIDSLRKQQEETIQYKQSSELLQQEIQQLKQEYTVNVKNRDTRIAELENVMLEYEKQIYNYGNSLQQKDKELTEYINQITKLNDVSQKLKSTIDLLEEEKAKDQNGELIKSLNKQIIAYQKKICENEDKLRTLEDEKSQLASLRSVLENQNVGLDKELKRLQECVTEKQNIINELQVQQQKHTEELATIKTETKERDEEIHEIKLQLRKESIENEKLRNSLEEKEKEVNDLILQLEDLNQKIVKANQEKDNLNDQFATIENKNKELMEKLKKFAINIKKKSSMYSELENQLIETQNQLEVQNKKLEQYSIQVETLPALQEKLKHAEEEINRIQSQKLSMDQQKTEDISLLENQVKSLNENLVISANEIKKLNDTLNVLNGDLHFAREENSQLNAQIDVLNKRIAEYEVDQKNNANFVTKISSLETDLEQKQNQIADLIQKLEYYQQQEVQVQYGHNAKLQERDLYIETLETEINKYKSRIGRLEESISIMEDRRQCLEKKADQLDCQLQEKEKAYSEYSNQEDELINRLAVLMDHDRVVEKQLSEIDRENKEIQIKLQHVTDENHRLRKSLSDIQEYCNTLVEKASKCDAAEFEITRLHSNLQDVEAQFKKVSHDYQALLTQRKKEIEELESEFNTQIENAIKDKKILGEKHEKLNEHVTRLEEKMQEYKNNNEILNNNLMELNRTHQEFIEKTTNNQQPTSPDYTDQYISEINNLNAIINAKNQEINDLGVQLQNLQSKHVSVTANLENQVKNLTTDSLKIAMDLERAIEETNYYKQKVDECEQILLQKEEYIKELKDKKSLTFEMNIPKTEGMLISSTIEAVSEDKKQMDVSSIEAQILSDAEINEPQERVKRTAEVQTRAGDASDGGQLTEPPMVQKKAYQCFQNDEEVLQESDPFNSDEGWGFGETEETTDVTPGLSHLNMQIENLQKEKNALKSEIEASNAKLIKALKKLKEFKSANESLTKELKISKQMSQSAFFDSAIEDELKIKVEELEKKVSELTADISKEKREKDHLRKQNEVFNNSIERLTEIKEKLDSEVELWKFKFKEVNDKLSSLQWGSDKDSPKHVPAATGVKDGDSDHYKQELAKIEKENDELQTMIDQLTSENKDLFNKNTKLGGDIEKLQQELLHKTQLSCEKCVAYENNLLDLQNNNAELIKTIESLNGKLSEVETRCTEIMKNYDSLKTDNDVKLNELQQENLVLLQKRNELEERVKYLENVEVEASDKIKCLLNELENVKSELLMHQQQTFDKRDDAKLLEVIQKYAVLEEHCSQLKYQLEEANNKIVLLENNNQDLLQQSTNYIEQVNELNEKVLNLNKENDNLLSTVTELRSSISSAVDQRGFEIAELWKQHLAQREADFQKIELELRNQLTVSEAKYEQLLDNMQSSSQEETNKMIIMEQVNSLQNKIQDKEDHLRDLQEKYTEAINQLDMLRSEMQDEKITHENKLLEQQEEYEKQIQEMIAKNTENSNAYEQTFKNIQLELTKTKALNDELTQNVEELNKKIIESKETISDLNNKLLAKDSEIYEKTQEFTLTLSMRNEEFENIRQQLLHYERKIEELSFEKESELAVLRLKIHENSNYYERIKGELEKEKENLTEELEAKILECTNLNKQIADLNATLEEDSKKSTEMQEALENQELEIINLKDEILNLQSMLRASASKIQKHVSFATDTKPASDEKEEGLNKELLDAVPRAELDLALYMLHQRDVRCEELTMELTQLLEERDTLQLRLSDSLRLNEELKMKFKEMGIEDSLDFSRETISDLPSFSIEKEQFIDVHRGQTSRSSSVSEHDGDKPKLQAKLSELRTVRHSRDVRFRQESEQRQMDMRLLHRDVANLPPEAVEQLNQAHHTLSRDSQSTSTILLNWFRGKSTPKVVDM